MDAISEERAFEDESVTRWLVEWSEGNPEALAELMPRVYAELKKTARQHLASERSDHTLRTTDVVHEVYLRLDAWPKTAWQNRRQFFAFASRLMRWVLVDHARARGTLQRGDGAVRVTLGEGFDLAERRDLDAETLLGLDRALDRLAALEPRHARQIELRFFAGLTVDEAAEVLGISRATSMREWRLAKQFLARELRLSRD